MRLPAEPSETATIVTCGAPLLAYAVAVGGVYRTAGVLADGWTGRALVGAREVAGEELSEVRSGVQSGFAHIYGGFSAVSSSGLAAGSARGMPCRGRWETGGRGAAGGATRGGGCVARNIRPPVIHRLQLSGDGERWTTGAGRSRRRGCTAATLGIL